MLTVFTPAYNRANELPRLYDSLINQTCTDFEWVVVDDGSQDHTEQLMREYIDENILNIQYLRQENGGKMRAHNRGAQMAQGELFVCIDADDWLTPNAIETIISKKDHIVSQKLGGMMFLNYDGESTKIVGTAFPWQERECSCFDVYNKYGVTGDKTIVLKTSVLKEYPFPEIEGEKFVPEALVYNRISEKYELFCVNVAIKRVEYLPDGISNNYFNICRKNPKGQILFYKELYVKIPSLYNAAAYDIYCIYSKKKLFEAVKEHPNKLIALIMYIPAYIKYLLKERK